MKNVVIFDFDGTIADAIPLFREVYSEIAENRGLPQMDEQTYLELRKGSIKDVVKWVGIRSWQLPFVANEGRKIFAKKSAQVKLFDGIPELIQRLYKDSWDIYVLSLNSEQTIKKVLKRHGISDFMIILRRPPILGKSSSIKKLVRKNKYQKSNVWMVGDELRDVEGGKKAGVKTISVSWGLQDKDALKAKNPDFLVDKVSELSKILV